MATFRKFIELSGKRFAGHSGPRFAGNIVGKCRDATGETPWRPSALILGRWI
jgi:hypothetical protein